MSLPESLGPYRLQEIVGRGGMGTVYRAADTIQGRPVAVKVLSPAFASADGFRDRFEAEIRSLEKLRHPHIVELYGFGEEDGNLYYAMELVAGGSLYDELSRGRRFTWREVISISQDVCSALKHAHDHGVIHRDIKPANLLLDDRQRLKLTDFGIAKLFGGTSLTMAGGIIGTADYMAPEQAEGQPASVRCDLYSLGSVMYALLAGRPPFRGKSVPEVMHKVRFEPPLPVSRFANDVPAELEEVIERLLAKDPAARFPTALALSKRLQAIDQGFSLFRQQDSEGPLIVPISEVAASQHSTGAAETMAMAPDPPVSDQATGVLPSEEGAPANGTAPTAARSSLTIASTGPTPTRQFTLVDDGYRKRQFSEPHATAWQSGLRIASLIAGLAITVGGAWWLLRPRSADQIFQHLHRLADSGVHDRLLQAEDDCADFLARFPDDPRTEQVRNWQRAIQVMQLQRRMEARQRVGANHMPESVLEDLLQNALRAETQSADEAIAQLDAIIQLFQEIEQLSDDEQVYLDLARFRKEQMVERQDERIEMHRRQLDRWMAEAEASDEASARARWQSIIEVYSREPWAAEHVAAARDKLATPRAD